MKALTIAFVALAGLVTACTVMDGEEALMKDKPVRNEPKNEASHAGTQPTADAQAPTTQSVPEAGVAVTNKVVECDSKQCTGATPFCCASKDTGTCVGADTTTCAGSRFLMRCDDPSDCAAGEECCMYSESTTSRWDSFCTAKGKCDHKATNDTQEWYVMCRDDSQCPSGMNCWGWPQDYDQVRLNVPSGLCVEPQ